MHAEDFRVQSLERKADKQHRSDAGDRGEPLAIATLSEFFDDLTRRQQGRHGAHTLGDPPCSVRYSRNA